MTPQKPRKILKQKRRQSNNQVSLQEGSEFHFAILRGAQTKCLPAVPSNQGPGLLPLLLVCFHRTHMSLVLAASCCSAFTNDHASPCPVLRALTHLWTQNRKFGRLRKGGIPGVLGGGIGMSVTALANPATDRSLQALAVTACIASTCTCVHIYMSVCVHAAPCYVIPIDLSHRIGFRSSLREQGGKARDTCVQRKARWPKGHCVMVLGRRPRCSSVITG